MSENCDMYVRQIKHQEKCKTKWLDLNDPLVLEMYDLEIERCKLNLMLLKGQKGNIDLMYKILLKLKKNCIQKQENIDNLAETDYIDDGVYLSVCNRNKKINDDIDAGFQEYKRQLLI
jgi:hypothetical protein